MMTLSAYMEEKAAKYRMEALGRMRVALAGSPPNGFISLMCDYFGYKGEEPVASTTSTVPPPTTAAQPTSGTSGRQFVPTSLMPVDPSTFLDPPEFGSGGEGPSGTRGPKEQLLTPYQTCADGVKPSSEQKRWSRTGLAAEYLPPHDDDLYSCPLPQCNYKRQNIDTVCIHIRRHLNIAIQCHYCRKLFWGSEGWLKHTKSLHKGQPPVPLDYGQEQPPRTEDILKESAEAYNIAAEEERTGLEASASLPDSGNYSAEPDYRVEMETEEEA